MTEVKRRVKPTGLLGEVAKAKASTGVVLPMLKEVMIADHLKDAKEQEFSNQHIRPSEMAKGDWCPRATYYRLAGMRLPEEHYNFVLENIWAEGDSIEEKWIARARKTGKLWGTWKCLLCDQEITGLEPDPFGCEEYHGGHFWKYKQVKLYPEGSLLGGSEDGAFPHLGALFELKSVGQGTIRMDAPNLLARNTVRHQGRTVYDLDRIWKELSRPFSNHLRQVNIYLHLAEVLGLPFDKAVLFYEYKANQQVKEFVVTKSASVLDPLLDKARGIEVALGTGVPPPCGNPEREQCLCKTVEELNDSNTVSPRGHHADGSSQRRGEPEAGAPGDSVGTLVAPAGRRTTRRSQGHHGDSGQGSDGAVQEAQPLGEVPGPAVGRRSSRRAVRGLDGREASGVRADS